MFFWHAWFFKGTHRETHTRTNTPEELGFLLFPWSSPWALRFCFSSPDHRRHITLCPLHLSDWSEKTSKHHRQLQAWQNKTKQNENAWLVLAGPPPPPSPPAPAVVAHRYRLPVCESQQGLTLSSNLAVYRWAARMHAQTWLPPVPFGATVAPRRLAVRIITARMTLNYGKIVCENTETQLSASY